MKGEIIKKYYKNLIKYNFLPYWNKFVDKEYGGILNCISNDSDEILSDKKFTWSQGRWLWVLSNIYEINNLYFNTELDDEVLKEQMEGTWKFITEKSIYGENKCCHILTRDGQRLKTDKIYDASIYSDCFALIGMSKFVRVTDSKDEFKVVEALYKSIMTRLNKKEFKTEPYPIPEGYSNHGINMIVINTLYEYILMKQHFNLDARKEIEEGMEKINFILMKLYDERGHIKEFKQLENPQESSILERHLNPGHMLEDLWFIIEFLEKFDDLSQYLEKIVKIAKTIFKQGWDNGYGGIYRFIDCEGGKPKGINGGSPYESLVLETWDMKLWWVHSEALYLFLKLYECTKDTEFLRYYEKCFTYVFTVFPNIKTGEWIQIRDRYGNPQNKNIALPVKDPFHILRCFIKIIELYS